MVLTAFESRLFFSAVWRFDGTQFLDSTIEAASPGGTAFSVLAGTAHFLYLGSESRFDLAIFILTTNGSIGTRTWTYWDGTAWVQFIPGQQYDFSRNGGDTFDRLDNWTAVAFSGTFPHMATPPDTRVRYWVRCSVASVTTAPTVDQITMRPYASYATPTDVAGLLQLSADFSATTTPTRNTVENYIRRAQSYIDYKAHKSWRPNLAIDEEHDFNMAGFRLRHNYPTRMLRLEIWDGSAYDIRTEGRGNDYFMVPGTAMVYFSRYFVYPARFQGSLIWNWGFGEFNYSVRVNYIYGSDIFTNEREGGIVNDIATKWAAREVINSHDYSFLAVSGTDKITLDRKVEFWNLQLDDLLESLRSWEVV